MNLYVHLNNLLALTHTNRSTDSDMFSFCVDADEESQATVVVWLLPFTVCLYVCLRVFDIVVRQYDDDFCAFDRQESENISTCVSMLITINASQKENKMLKQINKHITMCGHPFFRSSSFV